MNCPYCHQEMESGFLQGWLIGWSKKAHKLTFFPGKGEVLLANRKLFPCAFKAYQCRQCHQITFRYGDQIR